MPYKLVIFDFDGTLADSVGWMKGVLNEAARRFGFPPFTPERIEALRGRDNRAMLADLGVPTWKLPFIAFYVRRLAARDAERIPLYPGITGLLAELEGRGVIIAVVSSNSEANIRRILGREAAARVRHYACSAGIFGKRAKFKAVLKRARIAANDAIAIGDEVRDIEAARAESIDTGAVTWGYATEALLRAHAPTAVFTTQEELLRTVVGRRRLP